MRCAVLGLMMLATTAAQACPGTEATGLAPPSNGEITAGFGMRMNPLLQRTRLHAGLDYSANLGDPVRAAGAGEVEAVRTDGGYGKRVIIDHGGGLRSLYAHLSATQVIPGSCVGQGDVVGLAGTSGLSATVHLHFEVVRNGSVVDPLPLIHASKQ